MASTGHEEAELNITLGAAGARALVRHFSSIKTLYLRYQPDENRSRNYTVTTASLLEIFSLLGDHPSIEHLVLDDLGDMEGDDNCHCRFPIQALTLFLNKAHRLKSLQLDLDTPIVGTAVEGNEFLNAIREHEKLDTLEIGDFGNENTELSSDFSPLSVPRWADLTISYSGSRITDQQVEGSILRSACLRKLLIDSGNGSFPTQHLPRILDELQQNLTHITELNILDDLNEQLADMIRSMVQGNTTLKHMFVSLGSEAQHGVTITKALQQNFHIESFRIVLSSQNSGEARKMVHNLRQNQSIRHIHFHFQGRSGHSRCHESYLKPFEEILEDNHTLEEIRLDRCHGSYDLTPQIEYGLSLNRAGRKELLQTTDQARYRSLWVEKVIANREDENIVYYFLSQNPSLLQSHPSEEEINTRKRKATVL